MHRGGRPSPAGLSGRRSACRSLFVCNGRPSVTDGIWLGGGGGVSARGTARNRLRRFIHQSADDGGEDGGQPSAVSGVRNDGPFGGKATDGDAVRTTAADWTALKLLFW